MDLKPFTHRYKMSKTLRFKLIPEGDTLANIEKNGILAEDQKRAEEYKKAKKILDAYHRDFISRRLIDEGRLPKSEELSDFAALYNARKQGEAEKAAYQKAKAELCKRFSLLFTKDGNAKDDPEFKALFGKDLIEKILPERCNEEEKETIEYFKGFTVYFTNYNTTRKNMYTGEEQSTGIANRIVNDNLPKFFDNVRLGERILQILPREDVLSVDEGNPFGITVQEILSPAYSRYVFTQEQIERYNGVIGGYTNSDGTKVQGLNEKINLYNQTHKENRLPNLKILFKQILAEEDTVSYVPREFLTDDETLGAVAGMISEERIEQFREIVGAISAIEKPEYVFLPRRAVGAVSQQIYEYYGTVLDNLPAKGGKESVSYYSISELQEAGDRGDAESGVKRVGVLDHLADSAREKLNAVIEKADSFKRAGLIPYKCPVRLARNDDAIVAVKELMDALKDFQLFAEQFYDGKEEPDADPIFYGEFCNAFEESLAPVIKMYDRVRNYVAKKPYSLEKYKLFFTKSDFLSGWAQSLEFTKSEAHWFEKDGNYYLFIVRNSLKKDVISRLYRNDIGEKDCAYHWCFDYQKVDYVNAPRIFIRSKGERFAPIVKELNLPVEGILELYENGWFKKGFEKNNPQLFRESLTKLIDYYKYAFSKHKSFGCFDLKWKPSQEYGTIAEFFDDLQQYCYRFEPEQISFSELNKLVAEDKGYLFRLYCKDFSPFSKGSPNLHTLYFKNLFDKQNCGSESFRLCGDAELFYRPASLKRSETTIHDPNVPLKNKNHLNSKKESVFPYEIIKDKRFTASQFELHIPIEMNYRDGDQGSASVNKMVRLALAEQRDQYVIGIDRGERNLLYVSLIDGNGRIVEQQSLNLIGGRDYHDLLEQREKDRLVARREWQTINGIKELKEGYLSQVVNRICQWVVQYGAIVVMEDLNERFKQIRSGIERSVYQKFETMLTNKLCYLADKKKAPTESGGILNAYQLATPSASNKDLRGQNGIIFYVSPWNTSKIDPTTGFAKLIFPKYKNEDDARDFIGCFRSIRYNEAKGFFEFALRYSDFNGTQKDYTDEWTVCTFGDRIETVREGKQLNQWVNRRIDLTTEFVKLFQKGKIDYKSGELKETIRSRGDKKFFAGFLRLLSLTLQMRNSVTGSTAPEDDYLISPVMNTAGAFYDSRKVRAGLPSDADANGAYNIARKGLMVVKRFRETDDVMQAQTMIKNEEWLAFAQTNPCV